MYTNDYYSILDLKRDATDTQIKQAYRVAALHSHPLKQAPAGTPIDREKNASHFRLVSEAFEVLSDPQKRALFDQYGEKGLKQGVPNGRGGITPTYVFSSNPETMFADHFGSTSPFADFFNHDATTLFTNTGREPQPQQLPPQEINLYCSLEELFQGCTKKVKATRKRVNIDGRTTSLEERVLTVDIRPGYKAGTKITFPKDGDEAPGAVPGDLVLIVREKPHPRLSRRGDDLVYRAKLSLSQALTGTTIEVETLDGRKLPIACAEIATPSSQQVIPHEGMPNPRDSTGLTRGNLIIEFDITFPSQLTAAQKQELKKILPA